MPNTDLSQIGRLTNLLCAQEEFESLVNDTQDVDIVFLDLAKTFDVVNHRLLLAKFETFSISPTFQ